MSNPTKPIRKTDWLRQVPSPVALLDHNFNLVDASDPWYEKFNFRQEQIQGKSVFDFFPHLSTEWNTKLQYALDGLKDIQVVDTINLDDNVTQNFIWHLNPFKDAHGSNIGVLMHAKDVTENKKLRLKLNQAKNLLKEKGKIAKIGSWEYDLIKKEVFLSPPVKDIFEIRGNAKVTIEDAIEFYEKGASRDKIRESIEQAIKSGVPWDENLQLASRNGETIWVNTIGRPKFKDGQCARIIGTVQDVTTKISTTKMRTGTSNAIKGTDYFMMAPSAMLVANFANGTILKVNQSFLDLMEFGKDEIEGRDYREFKMFDTLRKNASILEQLKKKGNFDPFDFELCDENLGKLVLRMKGNLITDTDDRQCLVISVENIKEHTLQTKSLEIKVSDANANIDKLVNFNHMVSHNLKGHATNFSLLLDFLEKENREKEKKKLVSVLKHTTENLSETIKGLREIVTIRHNNRMQKEALVLNDFIYRAEQSLTGLIKQKKVKIVNEVSDNTEVRAIPVYLESILTNCLSNAAKFGKPNKTPLIVFSADVNDEYTVVSIEDNGIGMDLGRHGEKLFGLYETLGNHNTSRGMGLYLTKYQIELMNGKIEVFSTPGEGSTFKIYFPNEKSVANDYLEISVSDIEAASFAMP